MNQSTIPFLDPVVWPTVVFVMTRITGLMMAAPLWSMTGVPRLIRISVGLLLALVLTPLAPPATLPDALPVMVVQLGVEFLIGLLIGLSAAVIVHGISLAGEIISMQMGLSIVPALNPMTEESAPGMGQLKTMLALMIYLALNGHLVLIRGLIDSFRTLPPGSTLNLDAGVDLAIRFLHTLYSVALCTAAPAMVALFLVNLAVAITGRAVPQFPAMMVIFPITITAGFVMITLALPSTTGAIAGWMSQLPARIAYMTRALAPGS